MENFSLGTQRWGTGEWIEKSAKFKINDINYREFVYLKKGNFDVIDCRVCRTRWKFANRVGVVLCSGEMELRKFKFCQKEVKLNLNRVKNNLSGLK